MKLQRLIHKSIFGFSLGCLRDRCVGLSYTMTHEIILLLLYHPSSYDIGMRFFRITERIIN